MPLVTVTISCKTCGHIFNEGYFLERWMKAKKCERMRTEPFRFEVGDRVKDHTRYRETYTRRLLDYDTIYKVLELSYWKVANGHLKKCQVETIDIEGLGLTSEEIERMIGRIEWISEFYLEPL